MKDKVIIALAVFAIFFVGVSFYLNSQLDKSKAETVRLIKNVNTLNTPIKAYKTKSGKSAVKTEAVTYTKAELKKYAPKTVSDMKDAGIRVQDVQSVTDVGFTAKIDTTVPTTKTDTSVCFNYADKNFDIIGCCYTNGSTANIAAGYTDSLQIIPTRVPYHFWFIRWGCKAVELNVIAGNKRTLFNYARYVELK